MAVYRVSSPKANEIRANLKTPTFALKWPEDTRKPPTPIVVQLYIDTKGFYLICLDKVKKEIECFDLALIHDTRTGTQVSLPQGVVDSFNHVNFGDLDCSLQSKWLTIYYGNTYVVSSDLRVIHFYFKSPSIATEWTEQLFQYGRNQILRNLSSLECLEKIYSKIIHTLVDLEKHTISVQNLIKFLNKNARDLVKETKIRRTLENLKLLSQNDSIIDAEQFTFNKFFRFYMLLMERHEVDKLFDSVGGKHPRYLGWESMKVFIKKQNDIRDDPFEAVSYEQKAKDLIKKYTEHDEHSKEKGMCNESFLRFLLSSDNIIIDPIKLGLCMDMDKPLSHYFISSSHNTYLTGNQYLGNASVEMYRQVLLTGCRCIELDVVDSERKNDEPEITHKNAFVKCVPFIDVIVAIKEYAFKVTSYPLILSIENHCGPKAQAKMAQYFVDIFAERLVIEPLKTHPCQVNYPLPSPNDLKGKILIKNKKLPSNSPATTTINNENVQTLRRKPGAILATTSSSDLSTDISTVSSSPAQSCHGSPSEEAFRNKKTLIEQLSSANPRYGIVISDDDFSDDDTLFNEINSTAVQSSNSPNNTNTLRESKATKAMSDLVHYVVPIPFKTFALAEERNRSYEMSSFSEDKAQNAIREHAKEFLAYNQRQLSRIYPRGTRLESSNYNPYIFWPIGCQMVALNYQTLDVPMQLNLGLFSFNGACGYIEKPSALCQSRSLFDPRVRANVENVVGYEISIKIISGQFLCQDREPTSVDVQIYGMYGDINKRHEYRVRAKRWNGFQAIYDDTDINSNQFNIPTLQVILPEMAAIRFAVSTDDGLIGQCFLPVAYLRSGYRHITLRNQINIPVHSSSLFIFIQRDIYVNAKDEVFANKLVDPLSVQCSNLNKLEKDSNNEKCGYEEFCSKISVRNHDLVSKDVEEDYRRRSSSASSDEPNRYQKHLIAASKLHDKNHLCKILSLNDVEPKELPKRKQVIHNRLRRVSTDYQKKIKKEEDRFQQCLILQHGGISPNHDRSTMTNSPQNQTATISTLHKKNTEHVQQCLLELYLEKLRQQEALECKDIDEYYNKLEKEINDDYNRQLNKMHAVFKEEKTRVQQYVRSQMKQERDNIAKKETDRDKIATLKEKSSHMNAKIGASTIQTLEEMYEQAKKTLKINLQTNLIQLEDQKCTETQRCIERYYDRYNDIKLRLERQMNNGEYDIPNNNSSSPCHSRVKASVSLSAISYHSPDAIKSDQQPRRQTMQQ